MERRIKRLKQDDAERVLLAGTELPLLRRRCRHPAAGHDPNSRPPGGGSAALMSAARRGQEKVP